MNLMLPHSAFYIIDKYQTFLVIVAMIYHCEVDWWIQKIYHSNMATRDNWKNSDNNKSGEDYRTGGYWALVAIHEVLDLNGKSLSLGRASLSYEECISALQKEKPEISKAWKRFIEKIMYYAKVIIWTSPANDKPK